MCLLKFFSKVSSFKNFAVVTSMPVFSVTEKGELVDAQIGSVSTRYRISFDVSDEDWDDFPAQLGDAFAFLEEHFAQIELLQSTHEIDQGLLDFAIYSTLCDQTFNQNVYLPRALVSLCAKLNLGVEISFYDREGLEKDMRSDGETDTAD